MSRRRKVIRTVSEQIPTIEEALQMAEQMMAPPAKTVNQKARRIKRQRRRR